MEYPRTQEEVKIWNLAASVGSEHYNINRPFNGRLVSLFWRIGTAINEAESFDLMALAHKLLPAYGSYFTNENLSKICLLAKQFNERAANLLAEFLTWEHILLLLQVDNWDARLFYFGLVIAGGLNVSDLAIQIESNCYANQTINNKAQIFTGQPAHADLVDVVHQSLKIAKDWGKPVIDLFKTPVLESFQPLFQPGETITITEAEREKLSADNTFDLLQTLAVEIEHFRAHTHEQINTALNRSLWKTGMRIRKFLKNFALDDQPGMLVKAQEQIQQQYGESFNIEQITAMLWFAELYPSDRTASTIIYLVGWDYIKLLLPLGNRKHISYYAHLAVTNNLNIIDLEKAVAANTHQQTKSHVQPLVKTTAERTGNNSIITTTISTDRQFPGDNAGVIQFLEGWRRT